MDALTDVTDRNDVALRGRLAAVPEVRELPSGDEVATFRLVVGRDPRDGPARADGKRPPSVDTLDCSAWRSPTRRKVARWQPGDVVEVEGCLRRRFYRAGGASLSRWDVLVRSARRVMRATGYKESTI